MPNIYHDKRGRFTSKEQAVKNARAMERMGIRADVTGAVPDRRSALRSSLELDANPLTRTPRIARPYEHPGVTVTTTDGKKIEVFDHYGPLPRAAQEARYRRIVEGQTPGLPVVDAEGNLYEQRPVAHQPANVTGTVHETIPLHAQVPELDMVNTQGLLKILDDPTTPADKYRRARRLLEQRGVI